MKRQIRLRGVGGDVEGMTWESESVLRAGRLASLEMVLDDSSVSRRHAELKATNSGWRVRDLGSTNGTWLNNARLAPGDWPLRPHDILRFGNVTVVVDLLREGRESDASPVPDSSLKVAATGSRTWEDAITGIAFERDRSPRPGEQLVALLRAGHHLVHLESEEDLLHSILNDAVSTLDAQRGAIVLAEGPAGALRLRALASGHSRIASRTGYSQSIANRSFSRGESTLCNVEEDPELACAQSIAEGTMSSVLCVLLRTPRKRLGVLHLDRGPMQRPFTQDDLHLADALAAHVSAGIESAQLLRKQRDLFVATITVLAQAVELRDDQTGKHTERVLKYSMLLGQHLDLPADDMKVIEIGTPLHDIGKIGIDDSILKKPGKLTPREFEIMKTHTTKGAKILEQIPELADVIPIVRSHHERWDGQGYPVGLKGEQISHLARIVAVADAFDAMTSDRPYRPALPAKAAFDELEKQSGRQFDPEFAAAFLNIQDRVVELMPESDTKQVNAAHHVTLRVAT